MIQQTIVKDYNRINTQDLLKVVSVDLHKGLAETFATVNLNLETAHKLKPQEDELEYVWTSMKKMEEKFKEHVQKEEQLLFPVFSIAKKREQVEGEEIDLEIFINCLISEHDWLKKRMEQIRKITGHYKCEPSNTPSHKLAYAQLNELEQDFNKTVFVEEKFLFPRALKIQGK